MTICKECGKEFEQPERPCIKGRKIYCSRRCKNNHTSRVWYGRHRELHSKRMKKYIARRTKRIRELKKERVALLGGKCEKCGYNKCLAALEFHHKDPTKKEHKGDWIKQNFNPEEWELLCSNCHQKRHYCFCGCD